MTKAQRAKKPETAARQKDLILWPFVEFVESDDIDGLFAYCQHCGINLTLVGRGQQDITGAIASHYQLSANAYDIDRAARDLATWPPIARRIEELRAEQQRKLPDDFGTVSNA